SSPLLEDVSIDGATGIIINITGNSTLSTHETNEAMTLIMEAADEDAEIIFGTVIDDAIGDSIKITVIATGLRGSDARRAERQQEVATGRTQDIIPSHSAANAEITPAIVQPESVQSVATGDMPIEQKFNATEYMTKSQEQYREEPRRTGSLADSIQKA